MKEMFKEYFHVEISKEGYEDLKESYKSSYVGKDYTEYCLLETLPKGKEFVVIENYSQGIQESGAEGDYCFAIAIKYRNKYYIVSDCG